METENEAMLMAFFSPVILEVSEPAVMTWQARVSVRAVSLEEELEESLYVLVYAT